jgi:ribulose-5-phosphate 4-epimerase/fuculose-1-phosphate aldolase
MQEEGVIKFDLRFTLAELRPHELPDELCRWRDRLWQEGLVGEDPDRYDGYGYGNVSCRLPPFDNPSDQYAFVISGSQTGSLRETDSRHYAVIDGCDIVHNRVTAHGPVKPSSEALTHAMVYAQDNGIHAVIHVHSPTIWQAAGRIGLPVTAADVAYGTTQMAQEVARLFIETDVSQQQLFAMGGHTDGVIAFGNSVQQAGDTLLHCLAHNQMPYIE